MSSADEDATPEVDKEAHVVQIYLGHDPKVYCTLRVSARDTVKAVIHNAVTTLGLKSNRTYKLLEVRESGSEERPLTPLERPLARILLWPVQMRRWHQKSTGYYFILQAEAKQEDIDDLCDLSAVTEECVLGVLRRRFDESKIYTYVSNILVAVNPNKYFPVYYNPKYVKMYEGQPLGKLSPHIFAIADVSFRAMLSRQADQCIVITGESGSGKTESCRYLIHCLTSLSKKTYSGGLDRTILGAGPVLEAFGNAKTADNDNSSRFGKLIQLNYLESGVIRGAVIEKFLLEKSRVTSREKNESSFHVFYYLLAGASKEEQQQFHLLKTQDYLYLKQNNLSVEDEAKVAQEYKRLHQAMEMVGFLAPTKKHIFSVLSAILLLGNVTFTPQKDSQALEVGPQEVLTWLSDLLKVKKERLVMTLTKKKIVTANTSVVSQYSLLEAVAACDSMARSLYSALFDWIVFHINHAMLNKRDLEESISCLSIGVLDLFSFENRQNNGFEQLCINYSNELQQHYINQQIFKLEQEEYVLEGIIWQKIDFSDNTDCIQLFNKKSVGLLNMLDEESHLPQGTNKTLLKKLKEQHHNSPRFCASQNSDQAFVVRHFAGKVEYQLQDFKQKNTDHMTPDVVSLLRTSEGSFFHHLVTSSPKALFRWGVLRATIRILSIFKYMARRRAELIAARRRSSKTVREIKQQSRLLSRVSSESVTLDFSFDHGDELPLEAFEDIFESYELKRGNRGSRRKQIIPKKLMDVCSLQHTARLTAHDQTSKSIFHPDRKAKPPSMISLFQTSLEKLMVKIEKAEPFFIFCVRSNHEKKQLCFDDKLVLDQIKHMGMLQMIHIHKHGYRAKFTFEEFMKKSWVLFPKGTPAAPEHIVQLFEKMGLDKSTYQIGKTKVFVKEKERLLLQETLNRHVMQRIITLQRWFRTCLIRQHFLQKRDASLIIQRSWRQFYEKHNKAATMMQTAWQSAGKSVQGKTQTSHENATHPSTGPLSKKKSLTKQEHVQPSDDGNTQSTLRDLSKEKREGRSTPPLNRPLSLPLGSKVGDVSPPAKAEKEKDDAKDKLHPESQRKDNYRIKGKSMSVDELSRDSSSGSESSSSSTQAPVRLRKWKKRKQHLAYTRSGLMTNFGASEEAEFWNFPLPPISPVVSNMKNSASSVDVRGFKSQVKPAEPDGSRYSLPPRPASEHHGSQDSPQNHPTTPEKTMFLRKFLKKMGTKYLQNDSTADKSATLPHSHSHHSLGFSSVKSNPVPQIRISRATRGLQWDSSLEREITDPKELQILDEFLGNQVNELQSRENDLSPTESVFLTATMQFRETIKSMFSLSKPQISYKDLMMSYHNKVNVLAGSKKKAEATLVVNLFRSVLDGFIRGEIKRAESEPTKTAKKRRKKEKCVDSPLDHLFSTNQVNIMQSCDLCGSYIWVMEKAYMCSACKLICHKKCLDKIITDCSTRCARKDDSVPGSLHFGVQVCVLTSKANPVPKVMEMLLMYVELNGLYTEGIYRKSGSACRGRELHQILQTHPETALLDNYPIHTVTGLVKRWLRELPDPLMTYSLYTDFLHAVELPDSAERVKAVYQKVDELPPANFSTLERLIFHLVRVAKEEEHNKMSPSSLAIVFAPCILRLPNLDDPLLGMKDVPKTTLCVEILINEQLRRFNEKMKNIQQLEYAESLTVNQLKLKRQNTILDHTARLNIPQPVDCDSETVLIERLKSIKEQKTDLACRLPEMDHEHSDSENLDSSSSMSSESLDQLGGADSEGITSKHAPAQKHGPTQGPPDLAQKVRYLMVQADKEQRELTPGQIPDVTQSSVSLCCQNTCPATTNSCITTTGFGGSFDDLDIPYIDEEEEDQS